MVKLPVTFGNVLVVVEFIVCMILAAHAIHGDKIFDKLVEAIRSKRKLVELTPLFEELKKELQEPHLLPPLDYYLEIIVNHQEVKLI